MIPKLKTKDQLPFKYFVVKNDNTQDFNDYINWLNNEFKIKWGGYDSDNYYGYDGNSKHNGTNSFNILEKFQNNPKVFTAKEFMDMLRQETKIVGYKAPYDLYNGLVKKGDILKYGSVEASYCCKGRSFPKEIVETWEPVYEEIKPEYKVGDWVTIINADKGTWAADTNLKTYQIEKLLNHNIYKLKDGWGAEPHEIRLATQEEIEKATTKEVDMGGFKLTVSPKGIFHKSENITEFVKKLVETYNKIPTKIGNFDAKVEDVVFNKTGCENHTTKLSQWKEILELYQKISA